MRYCSEQIAFQEVPGEVSLAYTITGCPVGCKGCHSVDSWPAHSGVELTPEYFAERLRQYRGLITCVLFLGGEWYPEQLLHLLKLAREQGLETCLYTGYEQVLPALREQLTYLKTGPWIAELGGLDSPNTNQKFIDLRNQQLLNVRFLSTD